MEATKKRPPPESEPLEIRVAVVHSLDLHYETLTPILIFLHHMAPSVFPHLKISWVLYCNVHGPEFRWWDAWWRSNSCRIRGVNIQPFCNFLQRDGFEDEFDLIVLDTDNDPIGQIIKNTARIIAINHTSFPRCPSAGLQFDIRPFADTAQPRDRHPVLFPCVPLCRIDTRQSSRLPRDELVVVGIDACATDWPVILMLASQISINIIARESASQHVPETVLEHPNIRISFQVSTTVMMETLLNCRALLVPKAGVYVHARMSGSIGLALSWGMPIILPDPMAAELFEAHLTPQQMQSCLFTYDLSFEAQSLRPFGADCDAAERPSDSALAHMTRRPPCGRNAVGALQSMLRVDWSSQHTRINKICQQLFSEHLSVALIMAVNVQESRKRNKESLDCLNTAGVDQF